METVASNPAISVYSTTQRKREASSRVPPPTLAAMLDTPQAPTNLRELVR